jgi:ATP-dependent Lon protease
MNNRMIKGVLLDFRRVLVPYTGLTKPAICKMELYLAEGDGSVIRIQGGSGVSDDFYQSLVTAKHVAELTSGKRFVADIVLEQGRGVISSGDSGGLVISLALISMLTKTPLNPVVTGTGKIDSDGNIYPVGNTGEKALAAREAGIKRFLVPYDPDFRKLPRGLEYVFVSSVLEAWDHARLPASEVGL